MTEQENPDKPKQPSQDQPYQGPEDMFAQLSIQTSIIFPRQMISAPVPEMLKCFAPSKSIPMAFRLSGCEFVFEMEDIRTPPKASSLIESLRDIGYSLKSAVADIIDNSIGASAGRIELLFKWDGAASSISMVDDGEGMSADELVEAMRPGSMNPLENRDRRDLGRFGLGLKTASFSQCRKLTVVTKKNDELSGCCWDLCGPRRRRYYPLNPRPTRSFCPKPASTG